MHREQFKGRYIWSAVTWATAGLFAWAGGEAAQAQSSGTPLPFLDGPYSVFARRSLSAAPQRALLVGGNEEDANQITFGLHRYEMVRTVRGGVITSDIDGGGSYVHLLLRQELGLPFTLRFYSERGSLNAFDDDTNPTTRRKSVARLRTAQDALRLEYTFRRHRNGLTPTVFASWSEDRERSTATIESLDGLSSIFSGQPLTSGNRTRRQIATGLAATLRGNLIVEIGTSFEKTPGEIEVYDTRGVRVTLPIITKGRGDYTAVKWQPTSQFQVTAFRKAASAHGTNMVQRETGAPVGNNETSYKTGGWGVGGRFRVSAGQKPEDSERAVSLLFDRALTEWDSHSFQLNPRPLGVGSSFDRVGYLLRGRLDRAAVGTRWEQRYGAAHSLQVDYQYIKLPVEAGAGYTGGSFLLGITREENVNYPDGVVHQVRVAYAFPLYSRVRGAITGTQAVPTGFRAVAKPDRPGQGPGVPSRTRGGWDLQLRLSYLL